MLKVWQVQFIKFFLLFYFKLILIFMIMIKRSIFLLIFLFFIGVVVFYVQEEEEFGVDYGILKDMIEFGLYGGYFFVGGDVFYQFSYGVGFYVRKLLDYVFLVCFDGFYGLVCGEEGDLVDDDFFEYEIIYIFGMVFGIILVNNFCWNWFICKINFYVLVGVGGVVFKFRVNVDQCSGDLINFVFFIVFYVVIGVGIVFCISDWMNIGLEYQIFFLMGFLGDNIDGQIIQGGGNCIFFWDMFNYISVWFNFNIGNVIKVFFLLYWVNLMENVMNELDNIKKNQGVVFQDFDGDGVIDVIDQELNILFDVFVDIKGCMFDSDCDGVADYKDWEFYFFLCLGEWVNEEGVVVNFIFVFGGGVSEDCVWEIILEEL